MSTILLIDDDTEFLEATRFMLEAEGFETATARTADEGLSAVKQIHPDLVILDVMLPDGYEGFKVARAIREEMKLHDLPIVILSGVYQKKGIPYRFTPDKEYLPVDVFLDKPIEPKILLAKIRDLLSRQA
jgi:DNA-binding response OmpR family regulator